MKTYALAALMALALLGLVPQDASAQYRCCGEQSYDYEPAPVRVYRVYRTAVVFDQNAWEAETDIRIKAGAVVHAQCRVGWCRILSGQFRNAYVLERCLQPFYRHYSEYDYDRYPRRDGDYYGSDNYRYSRPRYQSWYPGYDD